MVCVSAAKTLFHSINNLSEYVTFDANFVIDLNISQTAEIKIQIFKQIISIINHRKNNSNL